MKNPLEMWNGLSRNGKIAVVVGALALAAFLAYRKRKQAAAAASDTSSQDNSNTDTSTTDGTASDAVTGQSSDTGYSDPSMDPYTPISYGSDVHGGYAGGLGTYGTGVPAQVSNPVASGPMDAATAANASDPATPGTPLVNNYYDLDTAGSATGGGAPVRPHPSDAHGLGGSGKKPSTKPTDKGKKHSAHTPSHKVHHTPSQPKRRQRTHR